MRPSPDQFSTVLACVHQNFGDRASVALFGSQLNDSARGGDIDLLVETDEPPTVRQRALVTLALEQGLNLPVDIVATQRGTPGTAFARTAASRGQPLELAA